MSVKRIVFTVLCALLVLVLIMTGVIVVKLVQLFNSPDPTEPTETEPSASDTTAATDPSTEPSTQPSTEATTPPTTQPTVPPTTQPTESTGDEHTHKFTIVTEYKEPTCSDGGFRFLACEICGETDWQGLEKLDHTYGYGETIPVTCESDGCTRYTCTVCGYVDDRNVVLATGHAYDSGVFHAATCTEDAYTEYTCANESCPEKVKKEVQENTKTGHKFGNTWVDDGNGTLRQTCANCNEKQTTDDLKVTTREFMSATDQNGKPYKVYIVYVGTDHDLHKYHYTITDYVAIGELKLAYSFENGLSVTYTDSSNTEHTVLMGPTGGSTALEADTEPDSVPSTEPSTEPTGGTESTEPSDPTESTGTTDPSESTGTNE